MAIVNRSDVELEPTRVIDLSGSQGNAFFLLGLAKNLSKQMELDYSAIIEEMKSSDYEHLISVFDEHFGSIYTLVR